MTLTYFTKRYSPGIYSEIYWEKDCQGCTAIIVHHGTVIYKNCFHTIENAKRAITRNVKKYL